MITKRQVPALKVGRTKVARSSALPSIMDIRSLPTILFQTANIDHGTIEHISW